MEQEPAHYPCPNCGGKLWEYAIEQVMICEDCRSRYDPAEIIAAAAEES